jgi:uncharacterized protein (DUF1330 family)
MAAYLICDEAVHNREFLLKYLELAKGSVESFGGIYRAQAGNISVLEGDWNPETIVVVEFTSSEKARQWYASPEYSAALKVNPKAMVRKMLMVEGLA